jgi:hypothetical protein
MFFSHFWQLKTSKITLIFNFPFWLNFGNIENVAPEVLTQGKFAIIIALAN